MQLGELLELLDRVGRRCRGRRGRCGVGRLGLGARRRFLLRPALRLAARDAVADAVAVPAMTAVRATPRSSPGMVVPFSSDGGLGRVERGDDGLDGNAAAGDELAAGAAQRDGDRRRPAVLPHEHAGDGARLQRGGGLLEVVLTEQAGRRALELGQPSLLLARPRRSRAPRPSRRSSLARNARSRMRMIPRSTRSSSSGITSPVTGWSPATPGPRSRSGPSLQAASAHDDSLQAEVAFLRACARRERRSRVPACGLEWCA